MVLFSQLLIPLTYLRIKLEGKVFYDFILPFLLAAITVLLYIIVAEKPVLFGEGGYLRIIQSLIHLLIPFFIAALAAVSTFDRPAMDQPFHGKEATLLGWDNQKQEPKDYPLSRRQFLSYLFGYLSFVSLFLFVFALFCFLFGTEKNLNSVNEYKEYLLPVFLLFHSFVFWNLIITTLIGLFFLTEKIQTKKN